MDSTLLRFRDWLLVAGATHWSVAALSGQTDVPTIHGAGHLRRVGAQRNHGAVKTPSHSSFRRSS